MKRLHQEFEICDDRSRLDFEVIHGWLCGTYWSEGISRAKVEKAAAHSAVVVGAYASGRQAGYCRVVSDLTRFAWLADVYVGEAHRGRGLGRAIVGFALEHPDLTDVHNWILATKDAHGVYAKLGFKTPMEPGRLMQLLKQQVL